MNPLDPQLLARGLTYPQYRRRVRRNGETFDEVYANPDCTAAELERLGRLPPLTLVALAEDWCPDVVHTLPTWARVVEALPAWRLAIFQRDEHPALMDTFLYRGGARRIPVYAFYDRQNLLQTWWSGRSAVAQRAVDGWLAGRTFDQLGAEEKAALGERFGTAYREGFRRANFTEILTQLAAFFHLGEGGA